MSHVFSVSMEHAEVLITERSLSTPVLRTFVSTAVLVAVPSDVRLRTAAHQALVFVAIPSIRDFVVTSCLVACRHLYRHDTLYYRLDVKTNGDTLL